MEGFAQTVYNTIINNPSWSSVAEYEEPQTEVKSNTEENIPTSTK